MEDSPIVKNIRRPRKTIGQTINKDSYSDLNVMTLGMI